MKTRIYWGSTILLCLLMTASASMYLFTSLFGDHHAEQVFEALGYPSYIVIPLAIAKLAGVAAILTRRFPVAAEWAYAGFCFDMILATTAHMVVEGGGYQGALVGLILLATSRGLQDSVRAPAS
jgi:hypothetical protein